MRRRAHTLVFGLAALLAACSRSESPGDAGAGAEETATTATLRVFVVNEPLRYFAARIGGPHADVHFPAPAGIDPSTWTPGAETVAEAQAADLVLRNGAGYARWVGLASLPSERVVDTSTRYRERLLERASAVTHRHGPGGEHSHTELAFTTWLDPQLAILQATAVADALSERAPQHEARFRARLGALVTDLEELDTRLAAAAEQLGDAPILFSHPVYDYLIARFGLNAKSLHWEPGVPPTDRQWHDLDHQRRGHPARWLLWEAEPLPETAQTLRERGIESAVFDPCGATPEAGDFLAVLTANAARLEAIASAAR